MELLPLYPLLKSLYIPTIQDLDFDITAMKEESALEYESNEVIFTSSKAITNAFFERIPQCWFGSTYRTSEGCFSPDEGNCSEECLRNILDFANAPKKPSSLLVNSPDNLKTIVSTLFQISTNYNHLHSLLFDRDLDYGTCQYASMDVMLSALTLGLHSGVLGLVQPESGICQSDHVYMIFPFSNSEKDSSGVVVLDPTASQLYCDTKKNQYLQNNIFVRMGAKFSYDTYFQHFAYDFHIDMYPSEVVPAYDLINHYCVVKQNDYPSAGDNPKEIYEHIRFGEALETEAYLKEAFTNPLPVCLQPVTRPRLRGLEYIY